MNLQELVEKSTNISYTYCVTPEIYYSFQRCSNDYNPLHTDLAFANTKGFKSTVMYGNILNAFISHFVGMLLPTREVMIHAQDINFNRPVYLNDIIELDACIDKVYASVNVIKYKLRFSRINEDKEEIVAKAHV